MLQNFGQLNSSYRQEKSVNGYTLDILKSGLQKSVRRNRLKDALYYGYELDMFAFTEGGEKIRSNLIHRLMIMYLEDIGVANLEIYEIINNCIRDLLNFREIRKNKENLPIFCEYRQKEVNVLTELVYLLCSSEHSRECSYYKNVFYDLINDNTDISKKLSEKYDILRENKNKIQNPPEDIKNFKISLEFEKSALDYAYLFLYYLDRKDPISIYYCLYLYNNYKTLGRFYRCAKSAFGVFYLIELYMESKLRNENNEKYKKFKKYLQISIDWYKKVSPIKEDFLTFEVLVIGLIKNNPLPEKEIIPLDDKKVYILSKLYKKNIKFEKIVHKEYVLDMHTKIGKRSGKGHIHFAKISSKVVNQSPYLVPLYQQIYTNFKILVESSERSKSPKIVEKSPKNSTNVVNCKVEFIRPKYKNLKEWINDPNNVYIARAGVVFVDGERFPKNSSIFANPFKIDKDGNRDEVIEKYRNYIKEKLENDPELVEELLKLKNKNLGCWCKPEKCHGDVLVELIHKYDKSEDNQENNNIFKKLEENDKEIMDKISMIGEEKLDSSNLESQYKVIARAQLVTGNSKTDTYFAVDPKNHKKSVFVKGPYFKLPESHIIVSYSELKEKFFTQLSYIKTEVKYLIPDNFKDDIPPLGMRNRMDRSVPQLFLISEDVCGLRNPPTKIRSSKVWKDTVVVDWEEVEKRRGTCKTFNGDVGSLSERALFALILNMFFRKIFGIPDWAARNFIIKGDEVYSVDEEGFNKEMPDFNKYRYMKDSRLIDYMREKRQHFRIILQYWYHYLTNQRSSISEILHIKEKDLENSISRCKKLLESKNIYKSFTEI